MENKKEKLIDDEFKKVFKDFKYPFKSSDLLIKSLPAIKKNEYLKNAKRLKKNPVLLQEINETCRHLYYKLAVDVEDKENRMLYKGALLFTKIFWQRLQSLNGAEDLSELLDEEATELLKD